MNAIALEGPKVYGKIQPLARDVNSAFHDIAQFFPNNDPGQFFMDKIRESNNTMIEKFIDVVKNTTTSQISGHVKDPKIWENIYNFLLNSAERRVIFTMVIAEIGKNILTVVTVFGNLSSSLLQTFVQMTVFSSCLFSFLSSEHSTFDFAVNLLPCLPSEGKKIAADIERSITQIFWSVFMKCMARGISTFICFSIAVSDITYAGTVITTLCAMFPPVIIPVTATVLFLAYTCSVYTGWIITWGIVQLIIWGILDASLDGEIQPSRQYIAGNVVFDEGLMFYLALSIVLGAYEFGMMGIVIGPMLLVFSEKAVQLF